jgi:hypothetical protein
MGSIVGLIVGSKTGLTAGELEATSTTATGSAAYAVNARADLLCRRIVILRRDKLPNEARTVFCREPIMRKIVDYGMV